MWRNPILSDRVLAYFHVQLFVEVFVAGWSLGWFLARIAGHDNMLFKFQLRAGDA